MFTMLLRDTKLWSQGKLTLEYYFAQLTWLPGQRTPTLFLCRALISGKRLLLYCPACCPYSFIVLLSMILEPKWQGTNSTVTYLQRTRSDARTDTNWNVLDSSLMNDTPHSPCLLHLTQFFSTYTNMHWQTARLLYIWGSLFSRVERVAHFLFGFISPTNPFHAAAFHWWNKTYRNKQQRIDISSQVCARAYAVKPRKMHTYICVDE